MALILSLSFSVDRCSLARAESVWIGERARSCTSWCSCSSLAHSRAICSSAARGGVSCVHSLPSELSSASACVLSIRAPFALSGPASQCAVARANGRRNSTRRRPSAGPKGSPLFLSSLAGISVIMLEGPTYAGRWQERKGAAPSTQHALVPVAISHAASYMKSAGAHLIVLIQLTPLPILPHPTHPNYKCTFAPCITHNTARRGKEDRAGYVEHPRCDGK